MLRYAKGPRDEQVAVNTTEPRNGRHGPSWHSYQVLLETVERYARYNGVLAARIAELHARAGVASRLVEIDASALRDHRRYPRPGPAVPQPGEAVWWPRYRAVEPLRPNPGLMNYGLKGAECPLVGCAVAGLSRDVLVKIVAAVETRQRKQRDVIPVFLTDSTDFDVFRSRGYVFEYFPGPEKWESIECSEPLDIYAKRRYHTIKRKWDFARVVQFGPNAFPRVAHYRYNPTAQHRIIYFPDYTEANPYQMLLYQGLGKSYWASPGDIHSALAALERAPAPYSTIFHLHWEDKLHMEAPDEISASRQCKDFLAELQKFILHGGVFVWTVHNIYPHEQRFHTIHIDLCRRLTRLAHCVHVHSRAALPALSESRGLDSAKVHVIAHGNYIGLHDSDVTKEEARERFGIGPEGCVFLFFGKIREYKGVQNLVEAFGELDDAHARLIIAGRQYVPVSLEGLSDAIRARVLVIDRDIGDGEIGTLFAAADFVVLPYHVVLTSGSLLLALSSGRPVIVPALATLEEIIADGVNGYLFGVDNPGALLGALRRAMKTDGSSAERMRRNALLTAKRYDWATVGQQMRTMFRRAEAEARGRAAGTLAALNQDMMLPAGSEGQM